MACPSIWLPSTTGRRSSLRATVTKVRPSSVGRTSMTSTRCVGIAPGREPLHGHVAGGVSRGLVGDLDSHQVLVERGVTGKLP